MKRVGDDVSGFSADYDAEVGAVRVRAWGFWSASIAEVFAGTVSDTCRSSPKGTHLIMDMTDLKPLREEGQRSFGDLVSRLRELGVGRTTVTTASHLTKLQLLRLVAENAPKDSVEFAPTVSGAGRTR
jgi:hypothetical protein